MLPGRWLPQRAKETHDTSSTRSSPSRRAGGVLRRAGSKHPGCKAVIVVTAVVSFDPVRTSDMLAEARRAEAVCRALPGCQRYVLAQPLSDEGELLVSEIWDDMASFERHIEVAESDPALDDWRALALGVTATIYTKSAGAGNEAGDTPSTLWEAREARSENGRQVSG